MRSVSEASTDTWPRFHGWLKKILVLPADFPGTEAEAGEFDAFGIAHITDLRVHWWPEACGDVPLDPRAPVCGVGDAVDQRIDGGPGLGRTFEPEVDLEGMRPAGEVGTWGGSQLTRLMAHQDGRYLHLAHRVGHAAVLGILIVVGRDGLGDAGHGVNQLGDRAHTSDDGG